MTPAACASPTFFTVNFLLNSAPLTLDPARWYFSTSTTLLLIVSALAVYGCYASRGGEPLFGKRGRGTVTFLNG